MKIIFLLKSDSVVRIIGRLHPERSAEDWIKRTVMERIDTEEAAFAQLKRKLQ